VTSQCTAIQHRLSRDLARNVYGFLTPITQVRFQKRRSWIATVHCYSLVSQYGGSTYCTVIHRSLPFSAEIHSPTLYV